MESASGEKRVAASPETVKKLIALGCEVFLERGSTILLVTHDSNEAEIMTNKQIRMEHGQFL